VLRAALFEAGGQYFAADVDGDGASELICSANYDVKVRKWKDNALAPAETWKTGFCSANLVPGDYNGDNKTDMLCRMMAAPLAVAGTGGFQSDLMKEAFNGLGGSTELTYATSASFANTNGPPPKYTVATSTTKDGRGNNATTSYTYSGGYMDWWERRFLGFGYVKQTLPCIDGETACPYVETWLRQDLASAGKPSTIKRRDGAGNVLTTMTYEYLTNGSTVPRTSVPSGEWTHIYSGSTGECSTWPCSQGKRVYTQHKYDAYGNRIRTWLHGDYDAGNDETTTAWDFYPNTTAYIVGKFGRQQQFAGIGLTGQKLTETRFHYDGGGWSTPPTQGYVTQVSNWLNTNGSYPAKSFSYDNWGNQISATDETGRMVTSTYDSTYHEFPTSTSNAAGEAEVFQWDALCGTPSQRTDANGQVTTFQTDALCRPTQTLQPLGAFELRSYVNIGNPATQHIRIESPSPSPEGGSGNHWALRYFDGLGRTYRASSKGPGPQAIETETSHTPRGRVRTTTAPFYAGDLQQTTTYSHDSFDRPVAVTHPDSHQVTKSYGLLSTTTVDEHGHDSTSRTDVYGRPTVSEQQLAGQTLETQYSHDLLGRMTGMTDPLGNTWSWTFDSLGRNVQNSDPDAGVWTATFDAAGRMTTQRDAKAQQTTFTYDSVGRLATKSNSAGTVTFTRSEPRSGYYNVGQVTTVSSPGTSLKYDYDALGRQVRTTRNMLGYDIAAHRRYDARGLLKGITYPDNDEIGTTTNPLRYDAAGRPKLIPGIVTDVQYDAAGRPVQQTNANGTVTNRTYSPERGFLTGISTTGGSTIQNLSYDIDPAGLAGAVSSPFANESWSYGYDDLHRMTSSLSPSNPSESQTFQYDAIGRITFNSRIGYYTYPPGGSPRPHAPTDVAGGAMTYDSNGNLLSGESRTFTWNAENLPTQINTTQFQYDGLGERIQKTTGSTTVAYPLGDDLEVVNGTTLTKYVSMDGLGVVAKRVGVAPSVTTYWLHSDRLGSIQAITNASGAVVQRRTYRAYGDKIAESSSHAESRSWIDQRTDPETNLTYLHARYYDSALGMFLSPDPIGPSGGLNSYAYASGDPVNRSDRSGLKDRLACHPLYGGGAGCDGGGGYDSGHYFIPGGGIGVSSGNPALDETNRVYQQFEANRGSSTDTLTYPDGSTQTIVRRADGSVTVAYGGGSATVAHGGGSTATEQWGGCSEGGGGVGCSTNVTVRTAAGFFNNLPNTGVGVALGIGPYVLAGGSHFDALASTSVGNGAL